MVNGSTKSFTKIKQCEKWKLKLNKLKYLGDNTYMCQDFPCAVWCHGLTTCLTISLAPWMYRYHYIFIFTPQIPFLCEPSAIDSRYIAVNNNTHRTIVTVVKLRSDFAFTNDNPISRPHGRAILIVRSSNKINRDISRAEVPSHWSSLSSFELKISLAFSPWYWLC